MSKQKEALALDPIEVGRVPRGEADSTDRAVPTYSGRNR